MIMIHEACLSSMVGNILKNLTFSKTKPSTLKTF